jgi:sugar O-acyltransferase (sialic acid O-acetyltransferase NeuD family)
MLLVFGAGGLTLQILDTLQQLQRGGSRIAVVTDEGGEAIHGLPHFAADSAPDSAVLLAVAAPPTRRKLAARYRSNWSLQAESARVSSHAQISDGHILCHNTLIEADVRIGRHFQCNVGSFVGHQCVIGDFVTLSPNVTCNGNVHIGPGVFVGAGAIIRNGSPQEPLVIGQGAIIGMGAVVTTCVEPHTIVYGNPAKAIRAVE